MHLRYAVEDIFNTPASLCSLRGISIRLDYRSDDKKQMSMLIILINTLRPTLRRAPVPVSWGYDLDFQNPGTKQYATGFTHYLNRGYCYFEWFSLPLIILM